MAAFGAPRLGLIRSVLTQSARVEWLGSPLKFGGFDLDNGRDEGKHMRRIWILVAGTVTIAGLVAGPTAAYAGSGTSRQASSCSDLIKKYQKTNKLSTVTNFNDPKALNKLLKQEVAAFKALASNGPSELRASFKRLAAAFSRIDFTNPQSLAQLGTFGATFASDLEKIATYFGRKCNYTIPTSPSGAGTSPGGGAPQAVPAS